MSSAPDPQDIAPTVVVEGRSVTCLDPECRYRSWSPITFVSAATAAIWAVRRRRFHGLG